MQADPRIHPSAFPILAFLEALFDAKPNWTGERDQFELNHSKVNPRGHANWQTLRFMDPLIGKETEEELHFIALVLNGYDFRSEDQGLTWSIWTDRLEEFCEELGITCGIGSSLPKYKSSTNLTLAELTVIFAYYGRKYGAAAR